MTPSLTRFKLAASRGNAVEIGRGQKYYFNIFIGLAWDFESAREHSGRISQSISFLLHANANRGP